MLKRNGLFAVSLGIVTAITALVGVWTWPKQPILVSYGEEHPINDQYRPGGKACEAESLAAIQDDRERTRQAEACQKEAETYRQSTNDLVQQTRAADSAQVQVNIASQQLWTEWLQTLGGLLTLAAAVGAAIWARDAARQTEQANEIARARQAVEMRPWITLDAAPDAYLLFDEYGKVSTDIKVIMTNVGAVTAKNVVCWASMYLGAGIDVRDKHLAAITGQVKRSRSNPYFHKRVIAPSQTVCFEPDVHSDAAEGDIYRIIAYVEYDYAGSDDTCSSWACFDLYRKCETQGRKLIRKAEGNLPLGEMVITATGIGDIA